MELCGILTSVAHGFYSHCKIYLSTLMLCGAEHTSQQTNQLRGELRTKCYVSWKKFEFHQLC